MNKKIVSLFLTFVLMFTLVGCGKTQNEVADAYGTDAELKGVNVVSLKGPTSMGLVDLYNRVDEEGENANIDYKIVAAPDEVVAGLAKEEIDIAAIPANLAAVLYNKTEGKIKVIDINTLGVLYLASTDENIKTFEDIKGQTIILSGKGATPEFALRALLEKNGINPDTDVNLEYKSEHTEVIASMLKGEGKVALMPQPFLTVAQTKLDIVNTISLNDMWKDTFGQDLITGVTVARADFIEEHPDFINGFMEDYKKSVEFTNENVEEASKLIGKYGIVDEKIAEKAIPHCNIVFIEGNEMKEALSAYYEILSQQEMKSVGGQLPGDEIYYEK